MIPSLGNVNGLTVRVPRKGVGTKKFGMSLETRKTKLFWQDIPGFCWDIPGVPEKFEKKECSILGPYELS